ncbi:MAG: hypothetical protein EA349_16270, partial [Halomonadaceae bacterium]
VKPVPQASTAVESEVDILVHQLYVGTDLYLHEDRLNWQKLNNLLYVNVAMGAMTGFILERDLNALQGLPLPFLVVMIGILGCLVSLGFGIAIWFGTFYLQNRKQALLSLEEHMQAFGAYRLLRPRIETITRHSRFQRQSPTVWVLRGLPILLASLWLIVAVGYVLVGT